MNKPRIFLGSSGAGQAAPGDRARARDRLTSSPDDDVQPGASPSTGSSSSPEVDFAAFVFAQDDWTTTDASVRRAAPRDNAVFGPASAARSASGARSSSTHTIRSCRATRSDLSSLRPAASRAEVRAINQKLRKAIEAEGAAARSKPCGSPLTMW
jgi:hypothetical protein